MTTRERVALASLVALASSAIATTAAANPLGLDGYTGKYGATVTCNQCHNGGAAPQVALTGPSALTAGQVAEYTFKVTTAAQIVGMAAAASDGVNVAPATNTKQKFAEVVHSSLIAPDNNDVATFTFKITAPPYNGPITLWAVGNACNNNDSTSGDRAATTMVSIDVTGGVEKPPPTPDAGAPSGPGGTTPPGGGTPGGAGTTPGTTTTSPDGGASAPRGNTGTGATSQSSSAGSGGFVGPDSSGDDGGLLCSVGRARGNVPWLGLALVGAAIAARRRRR